MTHIAVTFCRVGVIVLVVVCGWGGIFFMVPVGDEPTIEINRIQ